MQSLLGLASRSRNVRYFEQRRERPRRSAMPAYHPSEPFAFNGEIDRSRPIAVIRWPRFGGKGDTRKFWSPISPLQLTLDDATKAPAWLVPLSTHRKYVPLTTQDKEAIDEPDRSARRPTNRPGREAS